ncbi:hypothetical protein NPIL_62401 [Nephila pilipes]|uniref:Uncharacterized protein n=1 Tax=Nephila pilipes TaxID=299642 RepID=A0A8X6T5C5_NEPPI|nr:hypothetical protein NPIL_62401 [Nephila pilipes]
MYISKSYTINRDNNISLLEAIVLLEKYSREVSATAILNCLRHAGLSRNVLQHRKGTIMDDEEENLLISTWQKKLGVNFWLDPNIAYCLEINCQIGSLTIKSKMSQNHNSFFLAANRAIQHQPIVIRSLNHPENFPSSRNFYVTRPFSSSPNSSPTSLLATTIAPPSFFGIGSSLLPPYLPILQALIGSKIEN